MMRYLKTLNDVQRYYCKLFKHNKFLIERNEVISYGDFDQLVTKIEKMTIPVSKARYDILKEFEQPFPTVHLIGNKSIFWCASLFALMETGFTVIPSHDIKDVDYIKHIPKIITGNHDFIDIIPPEKKHALNINKGGKSYSIILKTSGSSNLKYVPLRHRNFLSVITCMQHHANIYNVNEQDRFFSILPWSHSYGLTCELFFSMTRGCSIYIDDGTDTIKNLKQSKSTLFCVVPKVIEKIKKKTLPYSSFLPSCIMKRLISHNLRLMVSAGAYLSEENISFIEERLRLRLIKGYGLTECAPLVLLDGKPIDCNTVQIDEHNQNELLVSGTNVFDGYINIETKNIEYGVDSWFRTGTAINVSSSITTNWN